MENMTRHNCCCGGGRICPTHGDTTPDERIPHTPIPTFTPSEKANWWAVGWMRSTTLALKRQRQLDTWNKEDVGTAQVKARMDRYLKALQRFNAVGSYVGIVSPL